MATSNYEMNMCEGPILRKILLFAIPLMISNMLQLLFNAADVVIVGRFAGAEALAAVGSTSALNRLIVNSFLGFSVGASFWVSRYYGAKEEEHVQETVQTAICFSVLTGIFLMVFGVIFSRPLLLIMQSPEKVINLATIYLQIIFLGMPAFVFFNYGSAILRGIGDTKKPLYYISFAGILNVTLNVVFVVYFRLNVVGVAVATVISQYTSAGMLLNYLCNLEGSCRLNIKSLKIHKDKVWEIIRYGFPTGLQSMVFETTNVLIQTSVNSFGTIAMAGISAASNIEGFACAAVNSMHYTAMNFTSQNLGGRKYYRISKILIRCNFCAIFIGLLIGILSFYLGDMLISIYSSDTEIIAYGLIRLHWICGPYALFAIMDTMLGMQRGLGYTVIPTIVSLICACGFRILWILTVFEKWHSLHILFASYPISWLFTGVMHIICFFVEWKLIKRRMFDNEGWCQST